MLHLLQIAEILNLAHFVHALEKFLRDFRKYLSTCCALEIYLLSAGCAIVIRGLSPNPFYIFCTFCRSVILSASEVSHKLAGGGLLLRTGDSSPALQVQNDKNTAGITQKLCTLLHFLVW